MINLKGEPVRSCEKEQELSLIHIYPAFIEEYLGMRVESVDEVEIIRRMTEGIYDEAEFQKALAWTKANCKEGFDKNPEGLQKTREEKDEAWEFVVKMMVIIKDLMNCLLYTSRCV